LAYIEKIGNSRKEIEDELLQEIRAGDISPYLSSSVWNGDGAQKKK
jgi:hypothetical protein